MRSRLAEIARRWRLDCFQVADPALVVAVRKGGDALEVHRSLPAPAAPILDEQVAVECLARGETGELATLHAGEDPGRGDSLLPANAPERELVPHFARQRGDFPQVLHRTGQAVLGLDARHGLLNRIARRQAVKIVHVVAFRVDSLHEAKAQHVGDLPGNGASACASRRARRAGREPKHHCHDDEVADAGDRQPGTGRRVLAAPFEREIALQAPRTGAQFGRQEAVRLQRRNLREQERARRTARWRRLRRLPGFPARRRQLRPRARRRRRIQARPQRGRPRSPTARSP